VSQSTGPVPNSVRNKNLSMDTLSSDGYVDGENHLTELSPQGTARTVWDGTP
jgi:hypothetical protein